MKKLTTVLVALGLVAVAASAQAGGGEACKADAQSCLNKHSAKKTMGWLGVEYDDAAKAKGTYSVKRVVEGSPAAAAGVQIGDVFIALNGAKLSDHEAVKKVKGDWMPGQKVTYTIERAGKEQTIAATLGTMPEEVFASMVGNHMLANHVTTATAATTPATTTTSGK